MKNYKLAILAFASALALSSCGKKDAASVSELNGDWALSTGTYKSVRNDYSSPSGILSSTQTYDLKFDGAKKTGTSSYVVVGSTIPNVPTSITGDYKVTLSFDKKGGTYTMTTTESTNSTNQNVYYYILNPAGSGYLNQAFDVVSTGSTTTVETGNYTVNDKSGSMKKGSELLLSSTQTTKTGSTTKTFYKHGLTDVFASEVYNQDYSSYNSVTGTYGYTTVAKTTSTVQTDKTPQYSDAAVWTVIESTSKSLKVTCNSTTNSETAAGVVNTDKYDVTVTSELDFTK